MLLYLFLPRLVAYSFTCMDRYLSEKMKDSHPLNNYLESFTHIRVYLSSSILWGKDLQFSVKKAMIEIDTIILSLHHHRREGQRTKEEDERKERWSLFVSLDTHQLASADEAPRDDERPSDDQSGAISAVNKLEGADNDDNGGDEKDTKLKVDEQGMQRLSQHRQQSLERWLSLKSMHIEALIRESEKDIEITEKSIDDVENRSGDLRFFQRQGILVKHLKLADENIQKDANTDRLSNGRRKSKMKSRLMMKLKVISTLEKPKKHPVKCTRTQSKLTRTDSKTSTRHQMNWKPKKTKKQLRKRRSRKTVSGGNTGSTDRTEPKTDAGDEDSEKDVYFGSIGRRKRTIGNKIRSKMDREAELRDIIDNNGDNKESIDGSESNSVSSESSTESIYSVSSDDDMEFETDSGSSTSDNTKDSYFDDDLDSVYDENLGDARKGKQEGKEVIMEDFGMKLQEKGKEELRGGNNAIIEDISIMLEQSRTLKRNDIKLTQRAQLKRSVDIDSRMETTDKISETNGGKHNEIPRQRSDTNKSYVIKGKEKENISLCGQNRTGLDFNGSVSSMSEMRNIFHIGRIQGLLTRLSLLVEPKTYHTPISLSMGTISLNEETGTLRRDVKEEWEEKEKKKKQYQYERGGMGLVGESEMKSTVGQGCCSRNAVLNVSDKKEMITDAGREKQNKKGESSEHGVSQGAYYASSMDLIMRLKALRSEKDHGNTYNENGDKDKDADHVCWKREVDETFSGSYSTSASSSLNRRNHAESEVNADDGAPKQDIAFTPLTSVCQTWPTFARRETGYLSKVFICDKDNGNGSSSSDLRVESQRGRKLRIGSKPRKRWKRTKVKAKKQVKTDDVDWCKPKKCVRPPYSSFHRENNHSHPTPNSIRPQTAWVRAVKTWRTNVQDLLEHSSDGIRSKSSYVAGLGWRPRSAMVNPSSPSSSSKQPEIVVRRPIYSPHWNSAGDTGTASYGRRTNKHDRSHKSDTSYMKSAENKFRNKEVRVNQHQGCESTRSRPHSSYNYFLSHQSSNALSKSYQRPSSSSAYFSVPLHGKKDVIDASRRTHRAFRPSTARGYFCHIGDYNSKSRKNTKSNHGAFRKSSSRSDTHVGTKQANHVCHRNIVNATSRLGATKTVYVGPNFGAAVIQFKDGDATANKKIISGNTNIRFAIRETCESVRTREHKKARGRQSTGDSVGVGNMDDD